MSRMSKAWNRLFGRNNGISGGAKNSGTDAPRSRRVLYIQAHGPSGVPRLTPEERAHRKAKRTAKKQARRRNRRPKSSARRRGGGCGRGN